MAYPKGVYPVDFIGLSVYVSFPHRNPPTPSYPPITRYPSQVRMFYCVKIPRQCIVACVSIVRTWQVKLSQFYHLKCNYVKTSVKIFWVDPDRRQEQDRR